MENCITGKTFSIRSIPWDKLTEHIEVPQEIIPQDIFIEEKEEEPTYKFKGVPHGKGKRKYRKRKKH